MVVAHTGDTVYLDTEPGDVAELLAYLQKMVFWSQGGARGRHGRAGGAQRGRPGTPAACSPRLGVPPSRSVRSGSARRCRRRGLRPAQDWPGADAVDLLVPRDAQGAWWSGSAAAGARPAGTMAFEAMRVAALRPRLGVDTDDRTIPHEVGWIGSAVHLDKGCYRGQETVARVANLGPAAAPAGAAAPRRGGRDAAGARRPGAADGRAVGRVGTAARHHELGPVALALVKRSVPVDAELVAGLDDRAAPAAIDPSSVEPDTAAPPPGRAAQLRPRARP